MVPAGLVLAKLAMAGATIGVGVGASGITAIVLLILFGRKRASAIIEKGIVAAVSGDVDDTGDRPKLREDSDSAALVRAVAQPFASEMRKQFADDLALQHKDSQEIRREMSGLRGDIAGMREDMARDRAQSDARLTALERGHNEHRNQYARDQGRTNYTLGQIIAQLPGAVIVTEGAESPPDGVPPVLPRVPT